MFSPLHSSIMNRFSLPSWIRLLGLLVSISLIVRPLNAKTLPDSMDIDDREQVEDNSESAAAETNQNSFNDRILNSSKPRKCKLPDNEALQSVMEKVCELCHDMYSHQRPNMRFQCRAKCFHNLHFKKCLHLFSPTRSLRHIPHRRHSIVLD